MMKSILALIFLFLSFSSLKAKDVSILDPELKELDTTEMIISHPGILGHISAPQNLQGLLGEEKTKTYPLRFECSRNEFQDDEQFMEIAGKFQYELGGLTLDTQEELESLFTKARMFSYSDFKLDELKYKEFYRLSQLNENFVSKLKTFQKCQMILSFDFHLNSSIIPQEIFQDYILGLTIDSPLFKELTEEQKVKFSELAGLWVCLH